MIHIYRTPWGDWAGFSFGTIFDGCCSRWHAYRVAAKYAVIGILEMCGMMWSDR